MNNACLVGKLDDKGDFLSVRWNDVLVSFLPIDMICNYLQNRAILNARQTDKVVDARSRSALAYFGNSCRYVSNKICRYTLTPLEAAEGA